MTLSGVTSGVVYAKLSETVAGWRPNKLAANSLKDVFASKVFAYNADKRPAN